MIHNFRLFPLMLVLATNAFICSGCQHENPKVVLAIPQNASQDIFLTERAGMDEQASSLGLKVEWNGPSDSDPQRQVDLIAGAIDKKEYGIVVNPVGTNETKSAVQRAIVEGIPVVVARDPINLPQQDHLSFIMQDDIAGAQLICARLKRLTRGTGEIVILGLEPASPGSIARSEAIETTLQEDCPNFRIVDQIIAPYNSGYVQVMAEQALVHHPHLLAFVALNNRAGLGAVAALAEKEKKERPHIIVFDQSQPLFLSLRKGEIDSIVVQDMRTMGSIALKNIDADRHGQTYPHQRTLSPMLVTAQNIDLEATQHALLLNWRP